MELKKGQTVRNFGVLAKVDGFHEVTGDPILRPLWDDGERWLATAAECEVVSDTAEILRHKDGLLGMENL